MFRPREKKEILPPRWTPLNYHPKQAAAWTSKAKFVNLACGRGSGKTELARRKIVTSLAIKKPWAKPLYFFCCPTYSQAKRIVWKEVLDLIPKSWIVKENVMDLYIQTKFGSELYIMGMDQPARIEGVQIDGVVVDEACDQKPGSFDLSILPTLTHRNGWAWRIGVPKRVGIGSREFKLEFEKGLDPANLDTESYSWPTSEIVTPEQLAVFRSKMDVKDFNEQYNASWEQAGGLIFYSFKEKLHVDDEKCQYRPHLPLYIGMDFNVDPMCWVIGQIVEDFPHAGGTRKTLLVLDELHIRNTNTPECLSELHKRYQHHQERYYFCGDAASRQRRSSASLSDHLHIVNCELFKDKKVIIPKTNPAIANRFSVGNGVLMTADGHVSMYVHSRCKRLITDLNYRAYKEGTSIPSDPPGSDVGHITDALTYLLWQKFPMKVNEKKTQSIAISSF